MKNLRKYVIQTKTEEETLAAVEFVKKFTKLPCRRGEKFGRFVSIYRVPPSTKECIYCCDRQDFSLEPGEKIIPFSKIHTLLVGKDDEPVKVRLNEEYSAEITNTHVNVGCQKIPVAKVLQIAEIIKKNENNK